MNDLLPGRFDELLSRYLDASLDRTEEEELLGFLKDDGYARRFSEATQLNTEIASLLAGSVSDDVMTRLVWSDLFGSEDPLSVVPRGRPGPFRRRTHLLLALAAMMVFLLAMTALHFHRGASTVVVHNTTPPATPAPGGEIVHQTAPVTLPEPMPAVVRADLPATRLDVVSVRGEVYFVDASGGVALAAGQPIKADGTMETVGIDSGTTLALADGTQITLRGNSAFDLSVEAGRRTFLLKKGALNAIVAPQPDDAPLIFETTATVATVRGTELTIIEEEMGTYLIVTKGSVGLRRFSGGEEVLVHAGFFSHVEEDGKFRPWPIARLPKEERELVPAPRP